MEYLILFFVGIAAGTINVMSGGGSMLTLPSLIFLGLDGTVANGTNRIAILFQNIFAVYGFKRNQMSEMQLSFKLALFTLPGAVLGAILSTKLDNDLFNKVLAGVLIFSFASLFINIRKKKKINAEGDAPQKENSGQSRLIYPFMFLAGFYGGFIQVGVGFILMAILYNLLKTGLARVNMHKVFIVLIYTIPALCIFACTGNINWQYGLALAAGNSTGAVIATKIHAGKYAERIIRIITGLAVVAMAVKLVVM